MQKVLLFVTFVDDPHFESTTISIEEFEKIKEEFQQDPMPNYPDIYKYDAQAWFVIADTLKEAKLLAALRFITETSRSYIAGLNDRSAPYDTAMIEVVQCIMNVLTKKDESNLSHDEIMNHFYL